MATDFCSLNKVILIGQVFRVPEISEGGGKKAPYLRMATKEVFIFGPKKSPKPTTYYHLVVTSGSIAVFCAKYLSVGDLILVEGRLRNYPSTRDKSIWKTSVWADKVILLMKKDWLNDERKAKADKAIGI